MEIKPLKLDADMAGILFPDGTARIVTDQGGIVFGALEDGIICALAVISKAENNNAYIIHHLSEGEKGRREHSAALLDHIENLCKKAKVRYIYTSINEGLFKELYLYSIFSERRYMTLNTGGHIVIYHIQDIFDTGFAEKSKRILKAVGGIKGPKNLTRLQLNLFARKIAAQIPGRRLLLPNNEESRFFLVNGEIKACMEVKKPEQGLICISNIYVEKGGYGKYALPAMLASVLHMVEALKDYDVTIAMKTESDPMYNGVCKAFGQADVDLRIFESVKVLEVG